MRHSGTTLTDVARAAGVSLSTASLAFSGAGPISDATRDKVLAAAADIPEAKAVATVAAPYDPSHVEHQYDAVVERVIAEGEAPVTFGDKALVLRREFVEDVRRAHLRDCITTLRRPLLVMHSPTDNTVGIANASEIFRAARHPRSFVSLEGADHLLTGRNQARRAARIVSAWCDPYLADA